MPSPQDVELHNSLQRIGNPRLPNTTIYAITDLPNRGRGFIALQDISKSTRILAEQALFSINNVPRSGALSQNNKNAIWALVGQHGVHNAAFAELFCPGRDHHTTRFQANNFQMDGGTGRFQEQGIFLQASRINHSCLPNAHFAYNEAIGRLTVYAIANIERGKEILVSYNQRDYYQTRAQRHTGLNHYSFTCTCDACWPGLPFGRSSDGRRAYMETLNTRIVQNEHQYGPGERDQLKRDMDDLFHQIGIEGDLYVPLIRNYRRRAELFNENWQATNSTALAIRRELCEKAMADARQSLDLEVICQGFDSPEVRGSFGLAVWAGMQRVGIARECELGRLSAIWMMYRTFFSMTVFSDALR